MYNAAIKRRHTKFMCVAIALLFLQSGSVIFEAIALYHRLTIDKLISGIGSVDHPVVASEITVVDWYITKKTDCPAASSRVWRGQNGFYLIEPKRVSGLPANGVETRYAIQTSIPATAPTGKLELIIAGSYDCGDVFGVSHFTLGPVIMEVVEKVEQNDTQKD